MQEKTSSTLGIVGVGILVASWVAVGLASKLLPPPFVPRIWTVVVFAILPASLALGAIAGWRGGRWWFLLSVLSLLSEAFCLLSVAV